MPASFARAASVLAISVILMVGSSVFAYAEMLHNAMITSATTVTERPHASGLALAGGNFFSTLMLANGALDRVPPQVEEARVVGKFSMGGALPSRRLVVTSWREGHRIERVPVDRVNFDNFNRGDVVEVKVKGGLVGIPWVVDVFHR